MRHERSLRDEHDDGGRLGKRGSWHIRA